MANRYMKRCSISLVIRKMEIKTAVRCYLISIKLSSKGLQIANIDKDVEKREPSYAIGAATMQNNMEVPQKTTNRSSVSSSSRTSIFFWVFIGRNSSNLKK